MIGQALSTALVLLLMVPSVGCFRCFEHLLIVCAACSFFNLSGGAINAYTLELLGAHRQGDYGKYRLWNSISWGLAATMAGQISDRLGFVDCLAEEINIFHTDV